MTSFSAKTSVPANDPRLVVFVIYPNIVLLDLVGPLQVFSHAKDADTGENGYRCVVNSLAGGRVETNTVASTDSEPMANYFGAKIHTLVIVGGGGAEVAMGDLPFLEAANKLAENAVRVCSVCSGALVLAAMGVLKGRRAVTHWDDCDTLRNGFPDVRVEVDPIYVKDGHVWTSAGITAGMDMALAIVTEDLGRASAMEMARSMVTPMVRSGGQSQYSDLLYRQFKDAEGRFEALHQWIAGNLAEDLQVEALAARVNMSARNFSRLYSQTMGITPAKAVETMRTEAARVRLETTGLGVKQIAADCGFNDDERMRRAFVRLLGVSPTEYRQGFKVE